MKKRREYDGRVCEVEHESFSMGWKILQVWCSYKRIDAMLADKNKKPYSMRLCTISDDASPYKLLWVSKMTLTCVISPSAIVSHTRPSHKQRWSGELPIVKLF